MNKINELNSKGYCCIYCGKTYKTRTNVDKHITLCELLHKSNRNGTGVDELVEDIPSQKKMYKMLLELAIKYNKLEEKVDEINKWVVKKKKKINVIEWLNSNVTPKGVFDKLYENIEIIDEDIEFVLHNSFYDTLNQIFSRSIYNIGENEYPIYAFVQKANMFYIYDKVEGNGNGNGNGMGWQELSRDKLFKFLNKVHLKFCKYFNDWKKKRIEEMKNNDSLSITCNKTLVKIMGVEFKEDGALSRARSNMYSRMKVDMKVMVEYEFEF
jgi:hypothetical protein